MIKTYRGTVYPSQLDHMGHMNVQWYTAKFDEATWHLFAMVGITPTYIREKSRGMAALEQITKYKSEVLAGDLLICRTRVIEMKDKTLRFMHHMLKSETDTLAATTEIVAAHLDTERRKACPFPDVIRAKCRELTEGALESGTRRIADNSDAG